MNSWSQKSNSNLLSPCTKKKTWISDQFQTIWVCESLCYKELAILTFISAILRTILLYYWSECLPQVEKYFFFFLAFENFSCFPLIVLLFHYKFWIVFSTFALKYRSEQLNQHNNHIFAGAIFSSRLTSPTPCKKEKQYPSRIFNKQSVWNLLAWFPHQRPDFSHHLWSWKMEMSSLQPLHTSHSTAPGCPRRTKWKFGCYWGLLRQNCGAEA